MRKCSAPGKMILFGEHAVVYGEPALALAIDLRIVASVSNSSGYSVNGHQMRKKYHAYISAALDEAWKGPPVRIDTRSEIPSGSGLGSSAAVTVACIGAMLSSKGKLDQEVIARKSFEVERRVQGSASPTDTSTSTHGMGILVSPAIMGDLLWKIEKDNRVWNIHHCDVPPLSFVVGYTGIHAATGPLVAGVRKLVDSDENAGKCVKRIGEIALEGAERLRKSDKKALGRLMDENHDLLNALGVGHPLLERLVRACRQSSYGAKLTGAGGGGSMIALTDDPEETAKAISAAGGTPIAVEVGCEGVRLEP
jgi:mevalonate kinase